jgi:hypothetical protein
MISISRCSLTAACRCLAAARGGCELDRVGFQAGIHASAPSGRGGKPPATIDAEAGDGGSVRATASEHSSGTRSRDPPPSGTMPLPCHLLPDDVVDAITADPVDRRRIIDFLADQAGKLQTLATDMHARREREVRRLESEVTACRKELDALRSRVPTAEAIADARKAYLKATGRPDMRRLLGESRGLS